MPENIFILKEITATDANNIISYYKPQAGFSGYITTLKLKIDINSITEANFPYIPDDTPPDVLEKILEQVALETPSKEIKLFFRKGSGTWVERAPIKIFNKHPYYDISLIRFFSDANTIDAAEDYELGLQITPGAANALAATDKITIWGTSVEEKKNNGNEELAARIEALELALYGKLTNLPANSWLGRKAIPGNAEPHPITETGMQLLQASTPQQAQETLIRRLTAKQAVASPAAINIMANTWFEIGAISNVSVGATNKDSVYLVNIYIQNSVNGNSFPHWQSAGAQVIGITYWKAGGTQNLVQIPMETHNGNDFLAFFRLGIGHTNRIAEVMFTIPVTANLIEVTLRKFQ